MYRTPTPTKLLLPRPSLEPSPSTPILIKNLKAKIKDLEEKGRIKGSVKYEGYSMIQIIAYAVLLMEHSEINNANSFCTIVDKNLSYITLYCDYKLCKKNTELYGKAKDIATNILDCINRNNKLICIPVSFIQFGDEGGHANMLFYRPYDKTIERFEPHGHEFMSNPTLNSNINSILKELFEVKMKPFLGEYTPKYIPPSDICPTYKGFQALEGEIVGTKEEGEGFCGMWSLFTMEMMLLNPNMKTPQIIENALHIAKSDPQYLKNVIRGYVIKVEILLDNYIKRINPNSKFDFFDAASIFKYEFDIKKDILHKLQKVKSKSTLIPDLKGYFFVPKDKHELKSAINTHMYEKSKNAVHKNGDMNNWDVSNIKDMSNLFKDIPNFNEYIGNWNVSNVKNMSHMFYGCRLFNQDIGKWNVENVTNMEYMFYGCERFNQSINGWIVYNVNNMSHMFNRCKSFNKKLNWWNVRRLTNADSMFKGCHMFNQYLGNWYLTSIRNVNSMFEDCKSFNKELPWKTFTDKLVHTNMFYKTNVTYNNIVKDMFIPNTKEELRNAVIEYINEININKNKNIGTVTMRRKPINQKSISIIHKKGDINNWNVVNINDMEGLLDCDKSLLSGKTKSETLKILSDIKVLKNFNENIEEWNVLYVTNMKNLFRGCEKFNKPLNNWQLYNVTNMEGMFKGCKSFRQRLKWKKYKIEEKNPDTMFEGAGVKYEDAIVYEDVEYLELSPVKMVKKIEELNEDFESNNITFRKKRKYNESKEPKEEYVVDDDMDDMDDIDDKWVMPPGVTARQSNKTAKKRKST